MRCPRPMWKNTLRAATLAGWMTLGHTVAFGQPPGKSDSDAPQPLPAQIALACENTRAQPGWMRISAFMASTFATTARAGLGTCRRFGPLARS